MTDPQRIDIVDDEGVPRVELSGRDDWVEPICPACGDPIQWVLDMFSFTSMHGAYTLTHARCAWTREAFTREAALAVE